jgi:hypothetical protein
MTGFVYYWRCLSPLTKTLLLIALVNLVFINLILVPLLATPWRDTSLYAFQQFLAQKEHCDSWHVMFDAFDYFKENRETPLYSEIFFNQKIRFQYPPSSLLIIGFIETVFPTSAHCQKDLFMVPYINKVSWLLMIVTIGSVALIFNQSLGLHLNRRQYRYSRVDSIARTILIVCLAATFYPITRSYQLGQLQTWINALFALAFWCQLNKKTAYSGVLIGIMCLIKPQYSLLLIWGMLRKQWNFSIALSITILVGLASSIYWFGWTNQIDYLHTLSYLSQHGESFYTNQSINGLLNRLLFNGNNLQWLPHTFPPFNPWVYAGTLISSFILISIALFKPIKLRNQPSLAIDFLIMSLTCTIASPIAWEHHYGILLVIYAFLLPCFLSAKTISVPSICIFGLSYFLSSNYFSVVKQTAYIPILNILQSYLLIGALIVLVYLYNRLKQSINSSKPNLESSPI